MDIVKLINFKLPVLTGVEEHERIEKTNVVLNISLHCDVKAAGLSDDLSETVNYQAVQDLIVEKLMDREFLLIETIAEKAAELCLSFSRVERVEVEIIKRGTLEYCEGAAVLIDRRRNDF